MEKQANSMNMHVICLVEVSHFQIDSGESDLIFIEGDGLGDGVPVFVLYNGNPAAKNENEIC